MWFRIVMLKIYIDTKQAFFDDFSLQFIELLMVPHGCILRFLRSTICFFGDANLVLESALVTVQVLDTGVSFHS